MSVVLYDHRPHDQKLRNAWRLLTQNILHAYVKFLSKIFDEMGLSYQAVFSSLENFISQVVLQPFHNLKYQSAIFTQLERSDGINIKGFISGMGNILGWVTEFNM